MKRVSQFAAVIMVLLLGVQPALAGVACARIGAMRTACPMCIGAMGADCPMAHAVAADCTTNCCNQTILKAVVLPAAPAKPRSAATNAWMSTAVDLQAAAVPRSGCLPPATASSSPPRYLLSRVFRI